MKLMKRKKVDGFEEVVAEALTLYRALTDGSRNFGDARDHKGSAALFEREAFDNAGPDFDEARREHVERLIRRSTSMKSNPVLIAGVKQGCVALDGRAFHRPPCDNLDRLCGYGSEQRQQVFLGVLTECMALGITPIEVVAVAVMQAIAEAPGAFGRIENLEAHEAQQRADEERLAALCEKLAKSWTMTDVEFMPVNEREGIGRLVFRVAPEVNVFPLGTCGERLLAHLAASGVENVAKTATEGA